MRDRAVQRSRALGEDSGLVEATAPCREDSQGTSHPVRAARQMEAILLPLLPVQTALASMYVVIMPHLLLAAMALTVVGDFFLHATRGPRLIGVHLRGCASRTKRRAWRAAARHRPPDCRVNAHTAHLPSGRTRRLRPAGVVTAHRAPQGARVVFRDISSLARR